MEARSRRAGLATALRCAGPAVIKRTVLAAVLVITTAAARYRTANFIVEATDPNFAARVAQAAEDYRRQLAIEWLGKVLPDWQQPCPITVNVGPHLGAGGATTFVFDRGGVHGWRMTIQGPPDRLIDSVLPHEITHMIFASHFRRPLPRWADEGAATTVEHPSERNKYFLMLHQFLRSGQGISFSQMFAMKDYPRNPMPLYAQSYSLADYLIQLGGRRKYVEFVGDGLHSGDWGGAVRRNYGICDLGQLQNTWLAWVRQGSPPLRPRNSTPEATRSEPVLAAAGRSDSAVSATVAVSTEQRPTKPARPEPNLLVRVASEPPKAILLGPLAPVARLPEESAAAVATGEVPSGRHQPGNSAVASSLPPLREPVGSHGDASAASAPRQQSLAAAPGVSEHSRDRTGAGFDRPVAGGPGLAPRVAVSGPVALSPAGWRAAGAAGAWQSPGTHSGASAEVVANATGSGVVPTSTEMSDSQLARPQTAQGPRHIIIQWGTR